MTAIPTIAAIRFGSGLSPRHAAPADAAALLQGLAGPDLGVADYPNPTYEDTLPLAQRYKAERAERRTLGAAARAAGAGQAARDAEKLAARQLLQVRRKLEANYTAAAMRTLARAVDAVTPSDGFRERLVQFWADHFTVRSKNSYEREGPSAYVDAAIRPHVTGRFGDMLEAAALHPVMLIYLDQVSSFGPNSAFALRHKRGLNENLAREILELHALGVGGGYQQADVRAFAELLTGLSFSLDKGFQFNRAMAEPGAEVVLGKSYGGGTARLEDIRAALQDIARHPDTARHLARKLAVHFVADQPDPGLVEHLAAAYSSHDGDLLVVYQALLEHPASWAAFGAKARQPFDFVVAALRALAVPGAQLTGLATKPARQLLLEPLKLMGQPFQEPSGPNGWPEEAEAWINPQGLAGRIQWAMKVPERLVPDLPDPRRLVQTALADAAGARVVWAAERAETIAEGVGIILASPEFNRR